MAAREMIEVENVNHPGTSSRVDAEKYRAMRNVLLAVLPQAEPGRTQQEMLEGAVDRAPEGLWPGGAKVAWWVKTVQLDLEAKGLVVRDASTKPTRWRRV